MVEVVKGPCDDCPAVEMRRVRLLKLFRKDCGGPEFIVTGAEVVTDYEHSQAEHSVRGGMVCGLVVSRNQREMSAYLRGYAAGRFSEAVDEITEARRRGKDG